MMIMSIMWLAMLAQGANPSDGWVPLTAHQTKPDAVVRLRESLQPALNTCREVAFKSTGIDIISESQFTLVVIAVVDRGGAIQRFRIAQRPPIELAFTKLVGQALAIWRYEAVKPGQAADAFETTIALPKARGATQTSGCEPLKRQR